MAQPYIEYCAGSQLTDASGDSGGKGGHAFLYVEGLCKDYSKRYPQVIPCAHVKAEVLSRYPHTGVGISLDSQYRNVNWIAAPTRELTFSAPGAKMGESLTSQKLNLILNAAKNYRVFEGVKMHEEATTLPTSLYGKFLTMRGHRYQSHKGKIHLNQSLYKYNTEAYADFAALSSVGTDIAINQARDLACMKIPVTSLSALQKLASYLNKTNNLYYQNNKEYVWHMLLNNCSHLALNAVAMTGQPTPFFNIDPYLEDGSFWLFGKKLYRYPEKTISNVITPADGIILLKQRLPYQVEYIRAISGKNNFFTNKDLLVFSFKGVNNKKRFINDLKEKIDPGLSWTKRNIIYNNDFYTTYKEHFYDIKDATY